MTIILPNISDSQGFINWLHENVEIVTIDYQDKIKITLKCRERDEGYIIKTCNKIKERIL
jgi:hypothetical protein